MALLSYHKRLNHAGFSLKKLIFEKSEIIFMLFTSVLRQSSLTVDASTAKCEKRGKL